QYKRYTKYGIFFQNDMNYFTQSINNITVIQGIKKAFFVESQKRLLPKLFISIYLTTPLMVNILTGVLEFDFTVKDFVKGPVAVEALNVTLMDPVSPGLTGVFE